MSTDLYGYQYSVYAWIARLALREKGVAFTWHEVNPFADSMPPSYLTLHPFKRVPTLVHDGFVVYETSALTRYIDEAFPGPKLQPEPPRLRARMNQIISVVDAYAYWPLVRQVFSHGVFRPRVGGVCDTAELKLGLASAPHVLGALDALASGGPLLAGDRLSLADCHLAPMIGYFTTLDEGERLLRHHAKLAAWWEAMSASPAMVETRPLLPPAAA